MFAEMPMTPTIPTITDAHYVSQHKIEALFSNGIKKLIDFSPIISGNQGICRKLLDLEYFKRFTLDPFTIDWNNEIGFAPEYLYEKGTEC